MHVCVHVFIILFPLLYEWQQIKYIVLHLALVFSNGGLFSKFCTLSVCSSIKWGEHCVRNRKT